MAYNPDIHRRRSIRLKGYDYSQEGAYFVTICVILKTGCSFTSKITKSIDIQRFLPGQKSSSYPFPV